MSLTDCPPFEEQVPFVQDTAASQLELLRHELAVAGLDPNVHRAAQQTLDATERELTDAPVNRGRVFERLQGLVRLLHASGTLVRSGPELVGPIQRLIAVV